jgi:hypothetical protein
VAAIGELTAAPFVDRENKHLPNRFAKMTGIIVFWSADALQLFTAF